MTEYSYPLPLMINYPDQEAMIGIVSRGTIRRRGRRGRRPTNELRLYIDVEGHPTSPEACGAALSQFQLLLGILRAGWPDDGGRLLDEVLDGLGPGTAEDANRNQYVHEPHFGNDRTAADEEVLKQFSDKAHAAIRHSVDLRNALILYGHVDRNSADYYMIYEYAKRDVGAGQPDPTVCVERTLGIAAQDRRSFTQSANTLSPMEVGRHVEGQHPAPPWNLERQRVFIAELLRAWVKFRAANP